MYPAVHLTGPHEWDPSVLDYSYPSVMGSLCGPQTPMKGMILTLIMMNLGITPNGEFKLSTFRMTHTDI